MTEVSLSILLFSIAIGNLPDRDSDCGFILQGCSRQGRI